jgi:HSP20 family protein
MPEPTRLPLKADKSSLPQTWQPFESLRRDIDRLFDDFRVGFWRTPFRRFGSDLMPSWGREMTFCHGSGCRY